MAHLGDFDTSAVIYGKFTTYRPSTGATFTLGGTPALSVYKDNSTTQSTTGVTLTVDFDSVTGLHHFAIDTSADGTFYSAGSFFDIVITTGTVDSVSVTGSVVGSFTLRKNSALKPATAGRTLVVDAAGLADANTVKLGPSGTGTAQTARDIGASVLLSNGTGTGQLKLASGYVAMTWADIGSPTTTVNLSNTSIASVSGAVGSVTGNVGGNVTGSVGSVATGIPTAAAVADAVWDEAIAGHAISGSTGEALAAAGAAGDPWITALPGSYSAGQAGYILGTNLNATVSSRATQTSVDTVDDFLDTEIAAIKAKTDNLPASPAATGDIPTATENADALLARDLGSGSNAGSLNERTVRSALRHIRNKWSFSGTTLTVTKEDDSTTAWTSTVSTNAAADPITGSDPA